MNRLTNLTPPRTALIYLAFSVLWILLTDRLVEYLAPDLLQTALMQTVKGLLFVGLSALLIYLVLRNDMKTLKERDRQIRFQAGLLDDVSDAVIATDLQFHIQSWNTAAEHTYGWTADEVMGKSLHDVLESRANNPALDEALAMLKTRGAWTAEINLTCKDGRRVTVSSSVTVIRSEDGASIGYVGIHREITDRAEVLGALYEKQALLATAEEVSNVGSWKLDLTTQKLIWSDQLFRIFGLDREGFDGDMNSIIAERVHPEDRESAYKISQIALKDGEPGNTTFRILLPDGEVRTLKTQGKVFRNESGKPLTLMGYVQDVTRLKQAEEVLRASEERYRNLVEKIHEVVMEVDEHGNFVYLSPNYEKFSGYSIEDELGTPAFTHVHPDDLPALLNGIANTNSSHPQQIIKYRVQIKNGEWRWIETSSRLLQAKDGASRIIGVARDVTDRVKAEESLLENQSILAAAEEVAKIGSWRWDLITQKVAWSDEMFRLLGVDREKFDGNVGRVVAERIHPEDAAAVNESNRSVLEEATPKPLSYRIVLPDGGERTVWAQGKLIHDGQGKSIALAGYVQDITERVRAEAQIQQMKRLYATLSQVNQTIVRVKEQDELFQSICDMVVKFGEFSLAWVGLLNEESGEIKPVAANGMDIDDWKLPIINIHKEEFKHTMAVQAILTGMVLTNEDAQTDPRLSGFKKSIQNKPYHASAVVPFKRGGKVIGALGIVSTQAGHFKAEEELALLAEMGLDISFALDTMENERIKQQWADAFEHSAHGMVIGDVHTNRILACNPAFSREQGATSEELIGLPLKDMYRPEDQEHIKQLLAQSDREGKVQFEGVKLRKDGSAYPFQLDLVSVRDENGNLRYRVASQQDITERKQAEEALQKRESLLAEAQKIGRIGHWEWTAPGRNLICSAELFQILEIPPQAGRVIPQHAIADMLTAEERQRLYDLDRTAFAEQTDTDYEYQVHLPSGRAIWLHQISKITYGADGQPARMMGIIQDITERKKAESAQKRNEQVLRLFVEHSPASIAMFDRDMRYIVHSRRYVLDYQLPDQDLTGRSHYDVFPEIPERWKEIHRRCLAGNIERAEEDPFLRADGHVDYVHWEIHPWYEQDGSIGGIILLSEVVTERVQARKALSESEENYRLLAENITDVIWILDTQTSLFRYVSPSVERLRGYTAYEVMNQSLSDALTPPSLEYLAQTLPARLAQFGNSGVEAFTDEIEQPCKDGSTVWTETTTRFVKNPENGHIEVYGVSRDIGDRKRTETALRISEENYRNLAETSESAIAVLDREGFILYANPAAVRIWQDPQLIGKSIFDVYPAEYAERYLPVIRRVIDDQTTFFGEVESQINGRLMWFSLSMSPLKNPDDTANAVLLNAWDITERKLAEMDLAVSNVELQETARQLKDSRNMLQLVIDSAPLSVFWKGRDSRYLGCNNRFAQDAGFDDPLQLTGLTDVDTLWKDEADDFRQQDLEVMETGLPILNRVEKHTTAGGTPIWENINIVPLRVPSGDIFGVLGIYEDITERKLAEEALHESEARFSTAFFNSPVAQTIIEQKSNKILSVNDACCHLFGYSREEVIGAVTEKLNLWENPADRVSAVEELQRTGRLSPRETTVRVKSGEIRTVIVEIVPISWQGLPCVISTVVDITERKQAETALTQRLEELELLYQSGLALSSELEPKQVAGKLIEELEWKMDWHHIAIRKYDHESDTLQLLAFNQPGIENEAQRQEVEKRFNELVPNSGQGLSGWVVRQGQGVRSGNVRADERYANTHPAIQSGLYAPMMLSGHVVGVISVESDAPDAFSESDERLIKTIANQAAVAFENARLFQNLQHELTERIHAEQARRKSEERLHLTLQTTSDGFWIIDRSGKFLEVNNAYCEMSGYSREELLHMGIPDVEAFQGEQEIKERIEKIQHEDHGRFETRHRRKDGTEFDVEISVNLLNNQDREMICFCRDITERKKAERNIKHRNEELLLINTLNDAANRGEDIETITEIFARETRNMFNCQDAAVYLLSPDGKYLEMQSTTISRKLRDGVESFIGMSIPRIRIPLRPNSYTEKLLAYENGYLTSDPAEIQNWIAEFTETTFLPNILRTAIKKILPQIFKLLNIHSTISIPLISSGQTIGLMDISSTGEFTAEDLQRIHLLSRQMTAVLLRKQAEANVQVQLKRITALNEIDRAISSSLDMRFSLDVLLQEVTSQLSVDAASILLLNPVDLSLDYVAGKGFRSNAIRQTHLRIGQGHPGQAGLERRMIHIPNLNESSESFVRADLLKGEDFVEYYGVPLVAKGLLKGVLEIFNRSQLASDPDWFHYLETLGGQAAIAIDNAQLFEGMQLSNQELVTAYDATIAGWSHAMDLRDKETEGHTQRVTELTWKLAERMGISQPEMIHIRRGALLHDIGKLGVPDHILLKPGKLTDEEWDVMRQHPTYAFEMLLPIKYLRPALDIPYCHHEKWDGTGYPRKLMGEQIPLAARIFAIIDVWDALRSDRPYRPGWPVEKVRAHLLEQSGSHFDPQVVEAFMKMLDDNPELSR